MAIIANTMPIFFLEGMGSLRKIHAKRAEEMMTPPFSTGKTITAGMTPDKYRLHRLMLARAMPMITEVPASFLLGFTRGLGIRQNKMTTIKKKAMTRKPFIWDS